MQEDVAAFEAWALFLRVHAQYANVQLGLQKGVKLPSWPETQAFLLTYGGKPEDQTEKTEKKKIYGHYNRFLYRVMKFREADILNVRKNFA